MIFWKKQNYRTEDRSVLARDWGLGRSTINGKHERICGRGDETVLYLDCGGVYITTYIFQNS